MKIGEVKVTQLEFSQELYPESEKELKEIIKICIRNEYPFAVPILKEPVELKSALTDKKYTLNHVILVFHDHCQRIVHEFEVLDSVHP
jgi:hypothetical protein